MPIVILLLAAAAYLSVVYIVLALAQRNTKATEPSRPLR